METQYFHRQSEWAATDSLGKQIMVGTTPLTSLDKTDNRFFKDGIITSYSFKVIFIINRRTTDVKPTLNKKKIKEAVGFVSVETERPKDPIKQ